MCLVPDLSQVLATSRAILWDGNRSRCVRHTTTLRGEGFLRRRWGWNQRVAASRVGLCGCYTQATFVRGEEQDPNLLLLDGRLGRLFNMRPL